MINKIVVQFKLKKRNNKEFKTNCVFLRLNFSNKEPGICT